jgi:2-dehydropantoate 2-reductase
MSRIAVIGPGAIGGTVAAWLIAAGHDVTLCARTPVATLTVSHPEGMLFSASPVLTDPGRAGVADIVIVATKAYDAAATAPWLAALVGERTSVAILQNGVEHVARFAGLIDPARLIPAVVDIPAERTAPGVIVQRRAGTITLPEGAAARAFAALFADSPISATLTDDFRAVAWRKLTLNAAGIVSAITLQPAAIARDPNGATAMRVLAAECVAVGRAEGADLPDTLVDEVVESYRAADPASINSLHADRLAGRPMEIDARNGVIVRLGTKHGIATPANALAIALLSAAATTDMGEMQ